METSQAKLLLVGYLRSQTRPKAAVHLEAARAALDTL